MKISHIITSLKLFANMETVTLLQKFNVRQGCTRPSK